MSRVDDLIADLCPTGVEFKAVGEVTAKTQNIRWDRSSEKEFHYIDLASVDRVTHRIGDTATVSANNAPSRAQQIVRSGDVIFATTRPTQGRWAVISPEFDGQIASTGYCVLRPDISILLTGFLGHMLGSDAFQVYVEANQVNGNYPSIPDSRIRAYRIPVPPLEVQRAIVSVLDEFSRLQSELEAALKAELEARQEQSEYYLRHLLFSAANGTREMTLGGIGRVAMCKRVFKNETSARGEIPFYKIGTFGSTPDAFISRDLFDSYRAKYSFPKVGDILISAAGTIGRTVTYDGEDAFFQDSNIVWLDHDESVVSNAYLKHWYRVVPWATDGGTIKRLYNANLLRATILVPPRAVQAQIVEALNKYDMLVSDLSLGLPAELAARRKQYEYYRDKLLTFEEAAA